MVITAVRKNKVRALTNIEIVGFTGVSRVGVNFE